MPKSLINLDNTASDGELLTLISEIKQRYPEDAGVAAVLARTLATSGTQFSSKSEVSADVASTGGPSSLSTLLCPLFLRVGNAIVPKLGVPGRPAGGVDCLVQIPGYRASLTRAEIEDVLERTGYVHFLGGPEITPLDTRMFRLRQLNSAQEVPTLVAASLMAKKLAVGIKHAGLDIRVAPHGNFGKTWDAATQNARLFIEVGRLLEIQAKPVLTDGRYPYQPYIGRKESLLALFVIFRGESSPWLNEHYSLCQTLAISCMPTSQRPQLQSATISDLQNVFCENVVAQGGDIGALRAMLEEVESAHCNKVTATRDGFACFDLQLIRRLIVDCQNSCINTNRPFPDPVGIILRKRPGEWVRAGETLATIRVEDVSKDMVLSAMKDQLISVRSLPLSKDAEGIDHE